MSLKFNLKQIEAFVQVADLGSFCKAADRLNTTQPNISARIAQLENILDVILMERDAGSVRLTDKGHELLRYARKLIKAADDFTVATNTSTLIDGVLRLGVTELIVHTWLREFLRELKNRYPKLSIELTVDLSKNLEDQLLNRAIDLALQSGPFEHRSTGMLDLGVYPLIWVASPSLGVHRRKPLPKDLLMQYPILTPARGTQPFKDVSRHFSANRDASARLVPSSNVAACIQMTVDGYGCAVIPEIMILNELKNKELVKLDYAWAPGSLKFYARYDRDRGESFIARAAELAQEVSTRYSPNIGPGSSRRHTKSNKKRSNRKK